MTKDSTKKWKESEKRSLTSYEMSKIPYFLVRLESDQVSVWNMRLRDTAREGVLRPFSGKQHFHVSLLQNNISFILT